MQRLSVFRMTNILAASALLLVTTGCESSGGVRLGAVGSTPGGSTGGGSGGGGSGGGTVPPGGSGGGTVVPGQTGSSLARLPVGGLVGPNGLANTGILPNVGDPNQPSALSPILVTAGNAVLGVAGTTGGAGSSNQVTGTVTQLLTDTGQALVKTGNGQSYLVDGLAAAVGDAVTLNVADRSVTGGAGHPPLAGVSVLSPTQVQGSLATVGAASSNNSVTATVAPLTGLPVNGALQSTTGSLVDAVATTVNSAAAISPPTSSTGGSITPIQSVVGNVAPLTGGVTGTLGLGAGGLVSTPVADAGAGAGIGAGLGTNGVVTGTLNTVTGALGVR